MLKSAERFIVNYCLIAFVIAMLHCSFAVAADDLTAGDSITAYLKTYCSRCHNVKKQKGGINVIGLSTFKLENTQLWQDIINNIQRGDMPPEDEKQPGDELRRKFLGQVRAKLDRMSADSGSRDFRFTRLTNKQIAWSLKDILGIDRDYAKELIEDPVGKHGESLQSTLELSSSHMEVYLNTLQKAINEAVPDLNNRPTPYQLHGNDWEQQHYLNRNDLAHGKRRHHKRYRGPKWLKDDFQIPLPPNHFFRIYIDDNRNEGQFRVRLYLRNEPPQNGGKRTEHALTVFMDKGFKSPMHAVDSFTLKAQPGTQVFEVFGNVLDYPGVNPAPLRRDEDPYGITTHFKYRFISVQNCSPLKSPSDKPVKNKNWVIHSDAHFVRADDQWIDAWGEDFGKKNWLKHSHAGSDHPTRGKPSVYKEVMKDTSYAVIERIEFDLPWQWPSKSVRPFLKDGKITDQSITKGVRDIASRAWRRPLTENEADSLNLLIKNKLRSSPSKSDALRDLLAIVFADSRFLFYSDIEKTVQLQNYELVSRLAGFLCRTVPDEQLRKLAAKNVAISDKELINQIQRMIADSRSERFVTDFTSNWLAFSKLDQVAVNPNYYGWWNPHFKHYMKQESIAFLSTLLHEDLSCLNCLSSDFVVVNDMMAKYYGTPKPNSGHQFSRVPAPPGRGGILTQPGFLLAHSTGEDSHVVNRAVWLRSRLLGDPVRDPPPSVPSLNDQDSKDVSKLSITERLSLHRTGICYDCHKDVDPWGVAMEHYDATGKFRKKILRIIPETRKRLKLPVIAKTKIRSQSISSMSDLQKLLRDSCADEFSRGFSGSMLSFALGRPLTYREDKIVESIAKEFSENDHRMAHLIQAIVLHPEFRHPNGQTSKGKKP